MNDNETTADIIAEKRRRADELEASSYKPHQFLRERIAELRQEADRLEAAWKRERAKIEADALEVGGIVEAARKRKLSKNVSKNGADFGQLSDAASEMRYLASRLLREWQDAVGSNPKFSRYGCMVRRYEKEFNELVREFDKKQLTAIGDAAKLREALVKCRDIALQWQADEAAGVAGTTDKPHARSAAEAVVDMEFEINAALAAPPRNCDKYANHNDAMKAFDAFVREQGKLGFINPYTEAFKWLFATATEKEGGNK